jgi:predicted peptidase
MLRVFGIAVLGVAGLAPQVQPPVQPAPFVARTFNREGRVMPYRLFVPDIKAHREALPLVIWLHGASGVGTDNASQVTTGGNEIGSRLWIRPDIQARYPSFVVAPQTPFDQTWGSPSTAKPTVYGQLVVDLIDELAREYSIDRDRVYLVGQSRGGIGVWDLITKRPDVFAAAVPVCAVGDPKRIAAASDVRVWAFHGANDLGMPVKVVREMVAALKAAGGTVKYTEYPDLAHEIWPRAFADPDLPAWLFSQRRTPGDCTGPCRP